MIQSYNTECRKEMRTDNRIEQMDDRGQEGTKDGIREDSG